MSKAKLLSHQRLGIASSNQGHIGQFPDFGDVIFSGFAASHDSNSECHLGPSDAMSNSLDARWRLRGIAKSMAVSGPFGYVFSTLATGMPPVQITHHKCHAPDKHQGCNESGVGRWDPVRRVAGCWARAIQLAEEGAYTFRLIHHGYGQEVHFRQAHNSIATIKQKDDASISGTGWLVELAFAASYGAPDLGERISTTLLRQSS